MGTEHEARGAVPDASGKPSSFSREGRGSGSVPRSSWRVHRCCGLSAFRGSVSGSVHRCCGLSAFRGSVFKYRHPSYEFIQH